MKTNGGVYMKDNKIFYVYEWFKVETGEVFYVGKGSNDRYRVTRNRNKHFKRVYNEYECDVRIIHENLTEEEAYELEAHVIKKYREAGYGLTNMSDGGKGGATGVVRDEEYRNKFRGSNNPMYGRPWWDENTPQNKIDEWRSKLGLKGEKNPAYGKPFHERMNAETYASWLEAHKGIVGEKNPNYGNRKLSKKYKENPELSKEKQSRPASQNGRAKKCEMYTLDGELVGVFDYIGACAEYMIKNNICRTKNVNQVRGYITKSIKTNKPYLKHYFKTY